MQLQLTPEQKDRLAQVLTDEERIGAAHFAVRLDPTVYASSAFEIWHREPSNEGFVGDDAVEVFCARRRSAIAAMKNIPSDALVLLKATEGVDPLKIQARWNAFRASKR
jgi:hypothetical protein